MGTLTKYDVRITIQEKKTPQDGGVQDSDYGTESEDWVDFASRISANVQDVLPSKTKNEYVENGLRISRQPARVRIRYRTGITSAMQVILHDSGDRICKISSGPAIIGRREEIEFMVENYSS